MGLSPALFRAFQVLHRRVVPDISLLPAPYGYVSRLETIWYSFISRLLSPIKFKCIP
jgi:hypothetical protein